jgi:hypothetical protein
MRLAGTAVTEEDDRLAVIDPGPLGERGDRGLRDLRVLGKLEVLESFDQREPRVDQPASLAPLGPLGHLRLEQRGQVRGRGLLIAGRFLGQRPEPAADGREFELDGVRVDQGFHRLDLRRDTHRVTPVASSWS